MSNSTQPSSVDAYLHRAAEAWEATGVLPDDDQLRQIAHSVEMTDEASEEADRRARELTEEALEVLSDDQDRAEDLLRRAVLLSPVRIQPHFLLADLCARRFRRDGDDDDRDRAVELAQRVQTLSPDHTPSHALLDELGHVRRHDGISWKQAGLIVLLLVAISGSMSLFVRYFMVPDMPENATETVREHFEEKGPPPR